MVVAIDTIEVLAGEFPRRQQRLVEAWTEIHHQELLEDRGGATTVGLGTIQDRTVEVSSMTHSIHRVTGVEIVGLYTLKVDFEDGVTRRIDLEPVLEGELYGPLRDPHLFERVQIDREVQTLVWPNGADFDPATLHDWPEVAEEFGIMARRWKVRTTNPEGTD